MNQKQSLRIHVGIWLFYGLITMVSFSQQYDLRTLLMRVGLVGSVYAFIFYVNWWLLMPGFLFRSQFFWYAATVLLLLAGTVTLRYQLERLLLPEPTYVQFQLIRQYRTSPFGFYLATNALVIVFSSLFKLALAWFENFRLKAHLQQEKLEAELRFLRNQLSPHLLFNVLNNIYTFCYLKDDRAAPLVMQLSEMMRYTLYECHEARCFLSKEINFLQNFVSIQKTKNTCFEKVTFEVVGVKDTDCVAPLLLLPFFENAFKYADLDYNPQGYLTVKLSVCDQQLDFRIVNTKRKLITPPANASGVGLKNVQQRLELLYPGQYSLSIVNQSDTYQVHLALCIKS